MGSTSDKYSGKAKKMAGKMTDNKKMETQGKAKEEKGKMRGYFE
jgi:uncharacterized protein YjbJ (UPF0337 family)